MQQNKVPERICENTERQISETKQTKASFDILKGYLDRHLRERLYRSI